MEEKSRLLKRNPEPTKTLSRPQAIVTQPKSEPAKPVPTPDAGVGGSSLDTMVAACAMELMNARNSFDTDAIQKNCQIAALRYLIATLFLNRRALPYNHRWRRMVTHHL